MFDEEPGRDDHEQCRCEIADLTRKLAEAKAYNADWIERCRKFRAQDAKEANERIKVLEDALFSKGAMFDAPCFCCGYNGPNYFDPRIHECALRHHALAKALEVK
jgi:hypothetical protein